MPVVVTLNLHSRTTLVEADRIEKDPHIESNLLLFGTKNLVLPTPDDKTFITSVWSVPKSMVQFYAVGRRELVAPPSVEVTAPEPTVTEPPAVLKEAAEILALDRARAEAPSTPPKRRGGRKPKSAAEGPAAE